MSSSKTVTPSVRYKLDNLRTKRSSEKRARIGTYLIQFAEMAMNNEYVRDVKYDTKSGLLSFKYNGRRVVYWVGAEKMTVHSAGTYTVYDYYPAAYFLVAIHHNGPDDFNTRS